jgi:cytochrome c peroxidase
MINPRYFHLTLYQCLLVVCCWFGKLSQAAEAREMQLRFLIEQDGLRDAAGEAMTLSRCDFLLSGLAGQRKDGTWLETQGWYGLVSLGKEQTVVASHGWPAEAFQAVRFYIGPEAAVDAGDPQQWPADHALHPQASGLHWGWQGGYIYLALEGHALEHKGWSWHLATAPRRTLVTLPVEFSGQQTGRLDLAFHLPTLTKAIDLSKDGLATHSRPGDAIAEKLQTALPKAFRVANVSSDRLQTPQLSKVGKPRPVGTRAYDLPISARLPKVALPVDNPLTVEGVALGERLFHEKGLSGDGTLSCVSCHQPQAAFADAGKALSSGIGGKLGNRNSMPLFNLAWQDTFFWDRRVKGLRNQVWHPITDPVEMGAEKPKVLATLAASKFYAAAFESAFGSAGVTEERMGLALEQYLLTLVSQESRYDKAARRELTLTEQEQRGLELFITEYDPARGLHGADCFHCHGGNLFTNHQLLDNGLDEQPPGKFRAPSLRNIARTAPYMHDGRFPTLEAVLEHYDHGVKRSATLDPNLAKHPKTGLGLSQADKQALIAFLQTLTDEPFISRSPSLAKHP